jgi:hypothetical protein
MAALTNAERSRRFRLVRYIKDHPEEVATELEELRRRLSTAEAAMALAQAALGRTLGGEARNENATEPATKTQRSHEVEATGAPRARLSPLSSQSGSEALSSEDQGERETPSQSFGRNERRNENATEPATNAKRSDRRIIPADPEALRGRAVDVLTALRRAPWVANAIDVGDLASVAREIGGMLDGPELLDEDAQLAIDDAIDRVTQLPLHKRSDPIGALLEVKRLVRFKSGDLRTRAAVRRDQVRTNGAPRKSWGQMSDAERDDAIHADLAKRPRKEIDY